MLETRACPAVIVVTSAADNVDPDDNLLTFREALELSNQTAGRDSIYFQIGEGGPAVIQPLSPLPPIVDPVVIEGYQLGYATPVVEIDGSLLPVGYACLYVSSSFTEIRNLSVHSTQGVGIWLAGDANQVVGNFIGLDATGLTDRGNLYQGIFVESKSNFIANNVISGNDANGIWLNGPNAGLNNVLSNLIGTDPSGTWPIGNGINGVLVIGADANRIMGNHIVANANTGMWIIGSNHTEVSGNRIGTNAVNATWLGNASSGVRISYHSLGNRVINNIISGNGAHGVEIYDAARGNVVSSNVIGLGADGVTPIGNRMDGVYVGASGNIIGGDAAGSRNVISANEMSGIWLNAPDNYVAGNYIGTDAFGTLGRGNRGNGILVMGQDNTLRSNVISANSLAGVALSGSATTGTRVQGNRIGTDHTGTMPRGNGSDGVFVLEGASGNIIGTDGDGVDDDIEGNTLSGNGLIGVRIRASSDNIVAGNLIGTNASGNSAAGNEIGVVLENGSPRNRIGTNGDGISDEHERNVISGNRQNGIQIQSPGTSQNVVSGNYIGLSGSGFQPIPNLLNGILVWSQATDNLIGGNQSGAGNVISFNALAGVALSQLGTSGNRVQGNRIGTSANGGLDYGNGTDGVFVLEGASGNIIGTDGDGLGDAAEGNVLSGNGLIGIRIRSSSDNIIAGNLIGTNAAGNAAIANEIGVVLENGSPRNRIGTDGDGVSDEHERNVISGNRQNGIQIQSPGTSQNVVSGNYVGLSRSGSTPIPNLLNGILVWSQATDNLIGGSQSGAGNVISFNALAGVALSQFGTTGNRVQGNRIGTDENGEFDYGNGTDGVFVLEGASGNIIGTDGDGQRDGAEGNILSGNGLIGIRIRSSADNIIAGNLVGTNAAGNQAVPNEIGVVLENGSPRNRVGTNGDGVSDELERNVISGNRQNGIQIQSPGTTHNIVAGNYVGTDEDGVAGLGNGTNGVVIQSGATYNIIGGVTATAGRGAGNIVSGNRERGVFVFESQFNSILGNIVGLNVTGDARVGNGYQGVEINRSAGNFVGGTAVGSRNVIAGNSGGFGEVLVLGGSGNTIQGNHIGTNASGTHGFWSANGGIQLVGASHNLVGGSTPGAGNLISGNRQHGIWIWNAVDLYGLTAPANANTVQGNRIGVAEEGAAPLGNSGAGIRISFGASGNLIGSDGDGFGDAAEGNTIAYSGLGGIVATEAATTRNRLRGNRIFSNAGLGIDLGNDGVTPNDEGDADEGPNDLLNAPTITSVSFEGGVRVSGEYRGAPGLTVALDFYSQATADPAGYGEGANYVVSTAVVTDSDGWAAFNVLLPGVTSLASWITATATDPVGNTSEFSAAMQVNMPPVAVPGGPWSVAEGASIVLSAEASFDPDGTLARYEWDFDYDGNSFDVDAAGVSPTFSATALDGTQSRVVALRVLDNLGSVGLATQVLQIDNVSPDLTADFPAQGAPGQPRELVLTATDAGQVDTEAGFEFRVNWGDGTEEVIGREAGNGNVTQLNHSYVSSGSYTVSVVAIDKDGAASAPVTRAIVISPSGSMEDPLNPGVPLLAVGGTPENDVITVNPGGGRTHVSVTMNGQVVGIYDTEQLPFGRIEIYGQGGDDAIHVVGGVGISVWMYGGDGDDDLQGGAGNDVLLGGDGNDILRGGQGRDLLIGGEGADSIFGSGDDDLLIAGWTLYDHDDQALRSIVAEWDSSRPYRERVANLSGAGMGTRDNADYFLRAGNVASATVFEDDDVDTLEGNSGLDWFFATLNGLYRDVITDGTARKETISTI